MPSLTSIATLNLFLLCAQHAFASVGVVDIDDLLHSKEELYLNSPNPESPYSPWSHKPLCVHSTSLAAVGQKYCVYTSNTTGPNGISLIFSPSAARNAFQHLNDNPLDNFLTQAEAEVLFYNEPPYKVINMAGKGKGVIATRKIKKFETFMVDQASIVVDMDLEKRLTKDENLRLLKVAVDRLRNPGMVRDLSGEHGTEDEEEEEKGKDRFRVNAEKKRKHKEEEEKKEKAEQKVEGQLEEDVMLTNAFGSTIVDVSSRALFPLISRINHACQPNAFVLFSRAGISMAIKAYEDIEEGEEITISYLLLGQAYNKRQQLLKKWGFKCTCSLCSQPEEKRMESDIRRGMIEESEKKITELWRENKLMQSISLLEESIEMIQEENIYPMLTDEYAMLAKIYLQAGDREKAEEYGYKAFELLGDLGFLGVGDEREAWDLERMLAMIGERGVYE